MPVLGWQLNCHPNISGLSPILFGTIVAVTVSGGKGLGGANDGTPEKGWQNSVPQDSQSDVRAATNAVAAAAQTAAQGRLDLLGLQLGQMSQQFVLLRQAGEVMANHLVRS